MCKAHECTVSAMNVVDGLVLVKNWITEISTMDNTHSEMMTCCVNTACQAIANVCCVHKKPT